MAVSRCLLVDRTAKVEHSDDAGRTDVEILTDDLCDLRVGQLARAACVDRDGHRLRYADRVGELDLDLVSDACCHDVLCDIAGSICCGAVDLCRILAGESAAAMACVSAVCVDNDLAACETGIAVRSADNKAACRVDEDLGILVDHAFRNDRVNDILSDILVDLLLTHIRVVLCGNNNGLKSCRLAILVILDGDLCLSVRTKVCESAVLSDCGELQRKLLRKSDRVRHELRCLVRSIAEHHTLVTCADRVDLFLRHLILSCFKSLVDAHGDVCGLLVHGNDDCACICVKSHSRVCVADLTDRVAGDRLEIDICICSNLTHDKNKTCCHCCLAGNAAHRILRKAGVKHCVGNCVADLIRMSLCY